VSSGKFSCAAPAAASYNGGNDRSSNKIRRTKGKYSYDVLLTDETARYVFRILALKKL
jgi:hypothetical protein